MHGLHLRKACAEQLQDLHKGIPGVMPSLHWSLQVSESRVKAVNNEVEDFAGGRWAGIVRECVQGALNTHLIAEEDQIVSLYHRLLIAIFATSSNREARCAPAMPSGLQHAASTPA